MTQKNAKKTDVWMPLFIGDYLADTQRLTTLQHGAYLLLIIDYWRNGPPPNDDAVLAQITRLKAAEWRKNSAVIRGFFALVDGKLVHGRIEAERLNAAENQARRTAKAKTAAGARWHPQGDAPSNAPRMPQAMLGECPSPSPSVSKETAGKPQSIFDRGAAILGGNPGSARAFIGQLRKKHGEQRIAELLDEAERRNISEPRAWLKATLDKPANDAAALYASIDRTFGGDAAKGASA